MVMPGSNGWLLIRAKWWHQLSSTRSTSTGWPSITAWKFSLRARCQPGCRLAANSSLVGSVAAHTDRARRALEHVEVLRRLRQRRDGLDGAGAGSDDADDLVGELSSWSRRDHHRCTRSPNARSGTRAPSNVSIPGITGIFIRLRIPTAITRYRARISSPRSVRITQRDRPSSHSLVSTPVWNNAESTRSNRPAIASRCSRISSPKA